MTAQYATGILSKLALTQHNFTVPLSVPEEVSTRSFSALVGAGTLWVAFRIGRIVRYPHFRLSERIRGAGISCLLVLFGAIFLALSIDKNALSAMTVPIAIVFALAAFLFFIGGLVAAAEWFTRRRRLVSAGIRVPLRGFGLRTALIVAAVNLGAFLGIFAVDSITSTSVRAAQATVYILAAITLLGVAIGMAWCCAGWLYVRRVDSYYEQFRTDGFGSGRDT